MTPANSHQTVRLARGRHRAPADGVCLMELASMLAGEPFTDHPRSVCPVIAALLRGCNDRFDEHTRQRLYGYAAEAVGTAGDEEVAAARIRRCAEVVCDPNPQGRIRRWVRGAPVPPRRSRGRAVERFAADVVASFPPSEQGATRLLALIDELLAIRPADETHRDGGLHVSTDARSPAPAGE